MDEPVIEVRARFADGARAQQAAEALNAWFRWILDGSAQPTPSLLEPLGVCTGDWAWALDDVDWALGPHARVEGPDVRVSLETHETHLQLSGLLRALGARAVRIVREERDPDDGAPDEA